MQIIFYTLNWVNITKFFSKSAKTWDIEIKKPTNFQMTRFANSVPFIFVNLHVDYSAVRLALVNLTVSKENNNVVKDRSKPEEA